MSESSGPLVTELWQHLRMSYGVTIGPGGVLEEWKLKKPGCAIIIGMMAVGSCLQAAEKVGKTMSFLENDRIRLGADLTIGGSITHLSTNDGPNMINSHDWGRQIQMSFYSGPNPFVPDGKKPRKSWAGLGWNPIQSGDCYGNRSKVLEHRNDGKEIYVKCRPMHWPLNDQPGQCTFECWYRIEGNLVQVRSRLTNARDDKTQYAGRTQELPAVYTNGRWYKLVSYKGDRPFSGAEPTVLVDKNDGKGWPWRNFYTPEHWVALLDDSDWGLGVYLPGACAFTGGFAGRPKGSGGMTQITLLLPSGKGSARIYTVQLKPALRESMK